MELRFSDSDTGWTGRFALGQRGGPARVLGRRISGLKMQCLGLSSQTLESL